MSNICGEGGVEPDVESEVVAEGETWGLLWNVKGL